MTPQTSSSTITSADIRARFLAFFEKRGHAVIPSASLIPENDPTVLFNTAGMQPLVPFLLGRPHPMGTRLVDVQKCVRTGDIDDIGDNRHLTFFEMLGNWSLGDYFKKESIAWSLEFLTSKTEGLGLDPSRLYVTVFQGDPEQGIPRDEEAISIWKAEFQKIGMSVSVAGENGTTGGEISGNVRIIPLGVDDNFWIAGKTGPCGGDTEIFYDTQADAGAPRGNFNDLVNSFRLIEIWNNVFMEFNKTAEGTYEPLAKKNVDTGMGLERTTAVINGKSTVFETDCFAKIFAAINAGKKTTDEKAERIVADHVRCAVFMIGDGVIPSNTDRGYVLRRLLRRAVRYSDVLGVELGPIAQAAIDTYKDVYTNLAADSASILAEISKEETRFRQTLTKGLKLFEEKTADARTLSGKEAFDLYQSYGFPLELSLELAREKGITVDTNSFQEELKKHQDLSRLGAEQKFKGGLADTSDMSLKYHTATHLLNAALRTVLGDHVGQKGSNITAERLRFDFSHPQAMTAEQKKEVERLVNENIAKKLPVSVEQMNLEDARARGAIGVFGERYPDVVTVYTIGDEKSGGDIASREICGGPHVKNTSELAGPDGALHFKILKEEAVSAGVRRIKAVLA